jgi:hypothetical protein
VYLIPNRRLAYQIGLKDGCENPVELGSGMTWKDPALNLAYDRGVNVGQQRRAAQLGVVAECDLGSHESSIL